jgi:dUTP pyrophosphatase
MQLPEGYWCLITHRSSTENKLRLRIINGVIDTGYRGAIFTQVHNTNTFPITINHGDRLSQMVLHEVIVPKFHFLEDNEELDESVRGENGFGSSGYSNI